MYSSDDLLNQRIRLDRRRLESAHLKYAMLSLQRLYPELLTVPVIVTGEVKETVMKFTPYFYKAFCSRYAGKHFVSCGHKYILY